MSVYIFDGISKCTVLLDRYDEIRDVKVFPGTDSFIVVVCADIVELEFV